MSAFEPHWEVLPESQRALWPQLKASAELGLVLYGGTAAALRLGHRISVDFDFFTEGTLNRAELQDRFAFLRQSTVVQDRPDTLTVLARAAEDSVKVSFFGGIDMGRAGVPDRTSDGVIEVASLLDLQATKLKVVQQRIEAKDYRDIAAILRFQPNESLKALTFFEGGDLVDLPDEYRQVLVTAVRAVRQIPISTRKSQRLSALD
jgi:predicted nucleotidyltransferase component of viral defense system